MTVELTLYAIGMEAGSDTYIARALQLGLQQGGHNAMPVVCLLTYTASYDELRAMCTLYLEVV
jgi:hypothetical protein